MLNDQQLDRHADVLLWGIRTARTRKYNKNDIVLIQYDLSALGLCERLFEKILDAGMHPVQRINAGKRMEKSFTNTPAPGSWNFTLRLRKNFSTASTPAFTCWGPNRSPIWPRWIRKNRPGPDLPETPAGHSDPARRRGILRMDPLHEPHRGTARHARMSLKRICRTDRSGLLSGQREPRGSVEGDS